MEDQASTLRLIASNAPAISVGMPLNNSHSSERKNRTTQMRCLAVTGGKGGVGKSNLSVNLALELGLLGKQVGLLDADFGLANADLLCGVTPQFHLGHVVAGAKTLEEISIEFSRKCFADSGRKRHRRTCKLLFYHPTANLFAINGNRRKTRFYAD